MKVIALRKVRVEKPGADGRGKRILHDVEAAFFAGKTAVIEGEVGAGKSTLLHVMAGLIRPASGEVLADGEPVSRWVSRHRDLWRRKIGLVFQRPRLLRGLTVLENVCVPLAPLGLAISTVRKKASEALSKMGLSHMAGEAVSTLSGGEAQRVSCARAIVTGPELILADEPTAYQDPENAGKIMSVFDTFKQNNAIVVIVSHDPRIVDSHGLDARFLMEKGRLREIPA